MKLAAGKLAVLLLLGAIFGCLEPVTNREKGAGVGAVVGSSVGAGIGSVSGYVGTGTMVGAGLGVVTGLLVGDHFQALERKRSELDQQIRQCDLELQRLCDELEKLKKEIDERE